MNVKKSEQADMTRRSPLYFLIGLNIVLLIVFLLIEFDRDYTVPEVEEEVVLPPIDDEDVIITERQFDEPPPPIDAPAPPEIPVEMEAVDNDTEIKEPPPLNNQNETIPDRPAQSGNPNPKPTGPPPVKPPPGDPPAAPDVPVNRATAKRAMIYPGCEKYKDNNRELYQCFNKLFNQDLEQNLDAFELDEGEKKRRVTIAFEIDKNGNLKMTGLNDGGSEKEFSENAKNAFSRLASQMSRKSSKGKGIQPALNSNDEPAVMEYSIPITFAPPQ